MRRRSVIAEAWVTAIRSLAAIVAVISALSATSALAQEPYAGEVGQQLCAGGYACTGVTPEDARLSLGLPDAETARDAVREASFLFDDAVWMCAANGCTQNVDAGRLRADLGLTLEQVQAVIRLRPDLAAMMKDVPLGPDGEAPPLEGTYEIIFNQNRPVYPGALVFPGGGGDPAFVPLRSGVPASAVAGRFGPEGLVVTVWGFDTHSTNGRYVFTAATCGSPDACRAFVEGGDYDLLLLRSK